LAVFRLITSSYLGFALDPEQSGRTRLADPIIATKGHPRFGSGSAQRNRRRLNSIGKVMDNGAIEQGRSFQIIEPLLALDAADL
jgi:hypothetical protein